MRLLPGSCQLSLAGQAARAPCFVLHRMGFVVPRGLRTGRWALTPPFHPDPRRALRLDSGGLFSVTLSIAPDFRPAPPRLLRGMLPVGVRTFLCRLAPAAIVCPTEGSVGHLREGGNWDS